MKQDDQKIITRTSELDGMVKEAGGDGKLLDYLGHMDQNKVMREGHNTVEDWEKSFAGGPPAVTPSQTFSPKKKKDAPSQPTAAQTSGVSEEV